MDDKTVDPVFAYGDQIAALAPKTKIHPLADELLVVISAVGKAGADNHAEDASTRERGSKLFAGSMVKLNAVGAAFKAQGLEPPCDLTLLRETLTRGFAVPHIDERLDAELQVFVTTLVYWQPKTATAAIAEVPRKARRKRTKPGSTPAWLPVALTLLKDSDGGMSDAAIARRVEVAKSTLSVNPDWKRAKAAFASGPRTSGKYEKRHGLRRALSNAQPNAEANEDDEIS